MRMLHDVRFAVRTLTRAPGFTAIVVLTLALGIGAGTSIFTVVHAVVMRPLDYPEPGRLVRITSELSRLNATDTGVSAAELLDYRSFTDVFSGVAGVMPVSANVTSAGTPERIELLLVSWNYFAVLGVPPMLGRTFTVEDDTAGVANLAVVSHAFWQRRLGGDPLAVGRTVTIDDDAIVVVGVMPRDFEHPGRTAGGDVDAWSPAGFRSSDGPAVRSRRRLEAALGRLRSDVTIGQARARLAQYGARVTQEFARDYPADQGWRPRLMPLHESVVGSVATPMFVLLAGVGLLLCVACVNVAHLALARSAGRRQEMAVRQAVGASRPRLMAQVFAESLVLAGAAGLTAILVASWGLRALVALAPAGVPRIDRAALDWTAVGVSGLLSLLVALGLTMASNWDMRRAGTVASLKEHAGRATNRRAERTRSVLVTVEIAMATLLLIGAGLLVRTVIELLNVPVGFETRHLVTARVTLPRPNDVTRAEYLDPSRRAAFYRALLGRLSDLPDVERAALSSQIPLGGFNPPVFIEFEQPPAGARPVMHHFQVSPGYFETMGIPMLRGRGFGENDRATGEEVAIISQSAARMFWPGRDPIGERIRYSPDTPWMTIVGIAGDVLNRRLTEPPQPMLYRPLEQSSDLTAALLVRARAGADAGRGLAQAVAAIDPDVPVYAIRTMSELLSANVAQRRFLMRVLVAFGSVATVLALLGIYGVMAYSVSQRTREIGIRMAIGARREDVSRMILSRGIALTAAGLVAGTAAALMLTRGIRSQLFGVAPADPLTLSLVLALMTGVGALAAYLPARRAASVDPVVALRSE